MKFSSPLMCAFVLQIVLMTATGLGGIETEYCFDEPLLKSTDKILYIQQEALSDLQRNGS